MTRTLVDTSALSRGRTSKAVAGALADLVRGPNDQLVLTPVIRLELLYSARSRAEHHANRVWFAAFPSLPMEGTEELALDLQERLFHAGKGRAAGVVDLLTAAAAILHRVVLVHYDSDFDHIASVDDRLRARWIVPRGSAS